MDAENLVPFRARWAIVTEKDRFVAGIMIEDHEIYPTKDRKRFTVKAGINPEQVVNDYVELRFRYASMYAAELGNPKELSAEVVQKYRYKNWQGLSMVKFLRDPCGPRLSNQRLETDLRTCSLRSLASTSQPWR